ncbi:MAG: flagellar basal body-associated FliL family protein [Nitrospirae bacterium]|nr:flagellar basal body-associated FliL family protein [Candidatus Troglogloeales bacterium]
MAEEKPEEAGKGEHGEEEKPKKKGLPILWIIIGLLVVLLAGGAVYFLKFMKGPAKTAPGKGKIEAKEKEEEHAQDDEPIEDEEHAKKEGEEHVEDEEGHGGGKVNCPEEKVEGEGKKKVVSETFNLEPFIVNLSGASDVKFLKVTVKLKLAKAECTRFVEPHVPEIRDSILMLLSSKEYEMVNTVQGKMELRDEVLERVKNIVKGDKVKGAFFTDFVAQ